MSRPLQVGTTASFPFGPFVTTAGVAATDLTINASVVFISKNGATLVKLNNTGTSLAHDKDGWYDLTLDVTDLNTIGPGVVETNSASALHVWENIQVMTVPGYKFLFGSTGASHVDQVFKDLSSILNETSAIIADTSSIKVSVSSILADTTLILQDTSALKVDSTAIKGSLSTLLVDTSSLKVSVSSILNETSGILADTSSLKVDSTAIKLSLSTLLADTSALKVSVSSILNETSAILADTSSLKVDSTAIKDSLSTLLADTSSIKVSVSSILNETTAIITAISGIPATVLGVINDQVIDSTITDLERRRIELAALAGLTTGAGTTAVGFLAAGTVSTRVRIAAILSTLGERTAVVLDGTT